MNYSILKICLVVTAVMAFLILSSGLTTNGQAKKTLPVAQKGTSQKQNPDDNSYKDLRNQAINMPPKTFGVSDGSTEIYGVIMDWDMGNGVVTLVTFKGGDASIYLSTGGGIIGGVTHPKVKEAATQFVEMAKKYFNRTVKTDSAPLPGADSVQFCFLTGHGLFYAQEKMANIEYSKSAWLPYFEEANKVIAELRLTLENK